MIETNYLAAEVITDKIAHYRKWDDPKARAIVEFCKWLLIDIEKAEREETREDLGFMPPRFGLPEEEIFDRGLSRGEGWKIALDMQKARAPKIRKIA